MGPGQGGQRLDVAPAARRGRGLSARRSCCGGRARCRGRSPTRRAGPCWSAGTGPPSRRSRSWRGPGSRAPRPRASHLRIDPEIEAGADRDEGGAVTGALLAAGWQPAAAIQPAATRSIDLAGDEEALWGDLRKKWRQYVNKARSGGVRIVDAGPERLDEFYRIYQETAARAGFLIRAASAYRDIWDAFAPAGRARLLFAEHADGEPVATLFLVRAGGRVVEPYGGMTQAGADSRANYLLKWEAIRSSKEQGATSYDLWGLAHAGIDHFKTGFGGREIRYVGAYDLVLDAFGRKTYAVAQRARVRVERLRHGLRGGGSASGYGGGPGGGAPGTGGAEE